MHVSQDGKHQEHHPGECFLFGPLGATLTTIGATFRLQAEKKA